MEEDHAVMEDQSNTDSVDKVVGIRINSPMPVQFATNLFPMWSVWTFEGNCGSIEGNTGQEGLVTEPSVVLDETVGSVEAGFGPWMIDETRKRSKKIADQNPKVVPEVPAVAINKRNAQVYALRVQNIAKGKERMETMEEGVIPQVTKNRQVTACGGHLVVNISDDSRDNIIKRMFTDWLKNTNRVTLHGDASSVPRENRKEETSMHAVESSITALEEDRCWSPNFRRYLWEHCWESRPEIFVLLETRISGVVADKVIRNLGFYNSFRVEVHGFSGDLDSLARRIKCGDYNHLKSVFHGRCWSDNEERWLYFTVIYAIPQVEKWKMVWKHLMNLMPGEMKRGFWEVVLISSYAQMRGKVVQVMVQGCLGIEGGKNENFWHDYGVLWNGAMSESFKPTRGLRQGDPLSPYLFVLCMERLPHAISIAVNNGKWKPIRLCRSGPNLSHLFFADDFVLFVEASIEQCSIIRRTLEIFCRFSASLLSDYEISVQLHSFEIRDKLTVNSNQLWIPVLRSKYKWRNELPESIDSKICSNVWKGISQVWSGVRQSLVWNIGNGQSVEFWRDSWLSNVGPLNMFVANQLERDELLRRTVTSMVDSNGHWQWELIIDFVPSNITQRLAATMPPTRKDIRDWMHINISSSGVYAWDECDWDLLFGSLLWLFWKNRNRRIFDLEYIEKESVLVQGRRLCFEANRAIESSLQRTLPSHRMSNEHTHWSPPPTNWCKVNTDGSCKTGNGFATCGGVIRSSDGSWILGFGKLLGIALSLRRSYGEYMKVSLMRGILAKDKSWLKLIAWRLFGCYRETLIEVQYLLCWIGLVFY
ncbi:hypothetical protein F3Y22_tig00110940pilonHSYRG00583 [Hibiscus syriacus]|uniref:Reverse transcriptase domain-containing protein n=1 Tax=Hibiscus syriacus TaxID=106335 RepID=A0A6A2ZBR1_HIBSY|nr:hypothetical protein F3Y22_tig00110940pilonHSYRG00583 [Hibiscus syriacus]